MRYLFFSLTLLASIVLQAQSGYKKFQWDARPVLHSIDKEYENEGAVFVVDNRFNEYVIEKDGFFMYRTLHKIIHINNDKGIESFNKIYLPFDEGIDVVDVKARTILPGGKIIEMDKNNIKEIKDDDGQYKIFALEGLTTGCEVEYYYTLKKDPSFFGKDVFSSRVPVMKTHFELIAPQHLVFETKSYNALPESKEEILNEKRYLVINDTKLNAVEEEKYSMYQASLKRVDYKLSYNKARNPQDRLFTWNELAKKAYDIYTNVSDKDIKKIKDLLSDVNIKGTTDVEKIVAIENFMKKNFITRDNVPDEDAKDLGKVIKNKVASHKALSMMYLGLFSAANINYQLVLAGNRTNYTLDRNFEDWNSARNILIYFPSIKKFIAPTEIEYRYPWIPPTWAATNGLFCVSTTIGNFTTAVGEVKAIQMENVEHSIINLDVAIKLDKDEAAVIDLKQLYGGYAAPNYKIPFVFFEQDQQDKILKEMIKFGTNSENILSHSFENKEMEQADPYQPFVIKASVKSSNLIERAGEKLLLKIGDVIGRQVEMYDTKPRSANIDLPYAHVLVRKIEVTIPEGYQIKNLSDLNINEVYKEDDKETMGFVSNYSQKGNVLTIMIKETYYRVNYPKQQYEPFKKIINAAADFNKIVLILDKS